jgi:orotate phosphoribosyltransferase
LGASVSDRERLLSILKTKSYRQGRVVLASGKESDFYIDCRQTSLSAEGHLLIGRLFLRSISENFPRATAVGGPTLGADPLVSAVSLTSVLENWPDGRPLDAFIVRKEAKGHGTGAWIEGMANLKEGDPVVMLEDVVTTGGSSLRAVKRAEEAGLEVLGILVLVDRNEGGRENIEKAGYRLVSLYNKGDFVAAV